MTKQYGIRDLHIEPTKRQQIFDSVKEKAVKCADRTQLCAAIYPWILDLVHEYKNFPVSQRHMDSFCNELYHFKRDLSVFLPFVIGPGSKPLDLERMRDEALDGAIEMAIGIANLEVYQISINLSAIMANFVKDL